MRPIDYPSITGRLECFWDGDSRWLWVAQNVSTPVENFVGLKRLGTCIIIWHDKEDDVVAKQQERDWVQDAFIP